MSHRLLLGIVPCILSLLVLPGPGISQERVKIAYSSADASNTVWFTAFDAGLYRKHGLDVELVFIQSSTTSVSSVIAGDHSGREHFGRGGGKRSSWRCSVGDDCVLHQYTAV